MKITNKMIHPNIRCQGMAFRKIFRFKSESSFYHMQKLLELTQQVSKPKDIIVNECRIKTPDNSSLRLCIYRRVGSPTNATGLLWLHGGGYAIGKPEQDIAYIRNFLKTANCVIIAPDYRCSTAQPYPAAFNDAYNALLWMNKNTEKLGIRGNQLFIGGNSAGGGLAVSVAMKARDTKKVNIAFMMPFYPMLDDRMQTPSSQQNNAPVWDTAANELAWKMYLGTMYGTKNVPPYAAPARSENFKGLPPTYTFVGDIEPFYDETVNLIKQLRTENIIAEIDIYPGCFHGFNIAFPNADVSKKATQKYLEAFKKATENLFLSQN